MTRTTTTAPTGTGRPPRNHARRVEDLQDLHRRGLIRFVESGPAPGRVYVVEVGGERLELPTRHIDVWLLGWQQAIAAMNGSGAGSAEHAHSNGTKRFGHSGTP